MNSELPPRFAPLPVRLRPCLGEAANSYIRRLARANHLKPSFLHCYLSGPPQWFAKPLLENLAMVAGRSPEALERALVDASTLGGTNRPRRLPRRDPFAWRRSLAHRIAQEALTGAQVRALAKRYNIRDREVRFALETTRLTTTVTGPLTDPVTDELADLIESMISRRLNGRQIWTELMDHHDYLITYGSVRHYLRYARCRRPPAHAEESGRQQIALSATPGRRGAAAPTGDR
ncbi:hypothetical protein [Streptomyces sp. SAI-129]|uniref:hypothetical protein n=1 Tax=Streptomyces sp. SAI-129 TaxID=3377727 RepID=UPI003C7BE3FE